MARPPRLVVVGYPHHIILRGNNKSAIFYNDKDRRFFLNCLKLAKEKTNSKIYAYCLMTNHIHLLVVPLMEAGLAEMMQSLGRKYVQYANSSYGRTGTLWEGRYKSSLVDSDKYLLACSRYIELNPVRANIVKHPMEYYWSSFRFKIGYGEEDFIETDPAYLELGKTKEERQENYKKFILETVPDHELNFIRSMTQKCGIIGSHEFLNRIAQVVGRDISLRYRGRPKKSL